MTTDAAVTAGDPYTVIPGATYVLESDRPVTAQEAEVIKQRFEESTGAKCVIICPPLRLVKAAARD